MGRTKRQHAAGGGAAGRSLNTEEEKMSNKGTGVSRRNFLKGAALAGAATAGAAALAGCASGGSSNASADWMPASWDYETDVLVIGYGGAGMWASLIAADECQQKVLVLEKAPIRAAAIAVLTMANGPSSKRTRRKPSRSTSRPSRMARLPTT